MPNRKPILNTLAKASTTAIGLGFVTAALAGDVYSTAPAGDAQYAACLKYAATRYKSGDEESAIKGQTKAQAWCTCMWHETPEDLKGNIGKLSETGKGRSTIEICEEYTDLGS